MKGPRRVVARVVLATSLVALGHACGGAPEEAPAPTPQEPPAAQAPAAEVAPALPPPPPERHDTILLKDPGREPRAPLAVPVITGTPQRLVASVSVRDASRRRKRPPPPAIVAFDTLVQAVSSDGSKVRDIEHVDVRIDAQRDEDKAVQGALAGHVRELLTRGGGATIDPFEVARVPGLELVQGDLAPARTLAAAVAHGWSHLSIPVPAEPVGVGAHWTVVRRVPFFGIPSWQTLECTLVAVDGSQLEVHATVEYTLEASPSHDLPIDLPALAAGSGKAKLVARIERPAATPIEMRVNGKLEVEGVSPDKQPARRVAFDLRIDEDYLARPDPRVKLEGALVQGGLVRGTIAPGTTVWVNKKRVRVSEEGHFLMATGRDGGSRLLLAFQMPELPVERHVVHIEPRVFEPHHTEVPAEVEPQGKGKAEPEPVDRQTRRAMKRAAAQARQRVKQARSKITDQAHYRRGFVLPIRASVSVPFGVREIVGDKDRGVHASVAFAASRGGKVRAPSAGTVVAVETERPEAGSVIVIDHGHGLSSTLRGVVPGKVEVGSVVKVGQTLGKVHGGEPLDWAMHLRDTAVDPLLALRLEPVRD